MLWRNEAKPWGLRVRGKGLETAWHKGKQGLAFCARMRDVDELLLWGGNCWRG